MTLQELRVQFEAITPERGTAFINSIHSAYMDGGVKTLSLISYLDSVIDSSVPGWKTADRKLITLYGRILAAEMILLEQSRSYAHLGERTRLLLTWSAAVVNKEFDYVALFLDSLNYRTVETGLDWYFLQSATSLDIICHHLHRRIKFDKDNPESFYYIGKGCLDCVEGGLQLGSSDVGDSGVTAFSIADRIEVYTRNAREEKLKESEYGGLKRWHPYLFPTNVFLFIFMQTNTIMGILALLLKMMSSGGMMLLQADCPGLRGEIFYRICLPTGKTLLKPSIYLK